MSDYESLNTEQNPQPASPNKSTLNRNLKIFGLALACFATTLAISAFVVKTDEPSNDGTDDTITDDAFTDDTITATCNFDDDDIFDDDDETPYGCIEIQGDIDPAELTMDYAVYNQDGGLVGNDTLTDCFYSDMSLLCEGFATIVGEGTFDQEYTLNGQTQWTTTTVDSDGNCETSPEALVFDQSLMDPAAQECSRLPAHYLFSNKPSRTGLLIPDATEESRTPLIFARAGG